MIFGEKGLRIKREKSMVDGFVMCFSFARMDCTVPRFTVSCSRYAASRGLLRFSWLSSDSAKCKGAPCVQGIECTAQNRRKQKTLAAGLQVQLKVCVDEYKATWYNYIKLHDIRL